MGCPLTQLKHAPKDCWIATDVLNAPRNLSQERREDDPRKRVTTRTSCPRHLALTYAPFSLQLPFSKLHVQLGNPAAYSKNLLPVLLVVDVPDACLQPRLEYKQGLPAAAESFNDRNTPTAI